MKTYSLREDELLRFLRMVSELREIVKYYADKEAAMLPRSPDGEIVAPFDAPVMVWYSRAREVLYSTFYSMKVWSSMCDERKGHCANFNGNNRRDSDQRA